MKNRETNLKIAQLIAEDEGTTEILLPKFGWFHKDDTQGNFECKSFSEIKFDSNWEWLMLAGKKVLGMIEKIPIQDKVHSEYIQARVGKLMVHIGSCDIEFAYLALVEEVNLLTKTGNE